MRKRLKRMIIYFMIAAIILYIISANVPKNHTPKNTYSTFEEFYQDKNFESAIQKENGKYIVSSDLIIDPEVSIDLNSEILEFDCEFNATCGIYISGTLNVLNNSKITKKKENSYAFWYKKGSRGKIEDSTIEYTWTGKGKANEAGLLIESNQFKILGSVIQNSKGTGIQFSGKDIIIKDSIISHNGANGIEIFSTIDPAYFEVYNNLIFNNGADENRFDGCGVLTDNSIGILRDNIIFKNRYCGFETDCSKLNYPCTVRAYNNEIYKNGHDGLFAHENSNLTAYENTITSNRIGISLDNYQTGRETELNIYKNMIKSNDIAIEITNNKNTLVEIRENILIKNGRNIVIQDSYNILTENNEIIEIRNE